MDATYFDYFQSFFTILWGFLMSPVPVLNLPWITLFGGSLFIGVFMTALNHLLGYSSNASFVDNIRADIITDRNNAQYESRYQRSQADAEFRYRRSQAAQDQRWDRHHKKG